MKPSRRSSARNGRNTVTLKVDMSSVNALLAELKGDVHKAVRPAAQAAAEVLYQAVLHNVDALGKVTGNLRASIYQAFSEKHSKAAGDGYSRATYHVSWNPRKAPHAHLIEYGHIQKFKAYVGKDGRWYTNKKAPLATPKQIAARPFMRPAFNRQDEAVAAAKAKIYEILGGK
jgi:uncharacterized ParB-like nuclease family protein